MGSYVISQDIAYPMAGDAVQLKAQWSGGSPWVAEPAGHRVRFYLSRKPQRSALELYDAQTNPDYLSDGKITPDVDGRYTITVVEESCDSTVPHFSNDDAGSYTGVEHYSVYGTSYYYLRVGRKVQRTIGLAPHQVTVEAYIHANASTTDGGVVTAFLDPNRAPRFVNPTSDRANAAINTASVRDYLQMLGAVGYQAELQTTNYPGNAPTRPQAPSEFIETDGTSGTFLATAEYLFVYLAGKYNQHRARTANAVHGSDDGRVIGGVATPTTLAQLITVVGEIRTQYEAHRQDVGGAPAVHGAQDLVNTLPAFPGVTLADCITQLTQQRQKIYAHMILATTHAEPRDQQPTIAGNVGTRFAKSFVGADATLAMACELAADIKAKTQRHFDTVTIAAAYHAAADTFNSVDAWTAMAGTADLVARVNNLADNVAAHCGNYKNSDKSAVAFHGSYPDYGGKLLDQASRATDEASAIVLLEIIAHVYTHHVDDAGSYQWHGGTTGNVNPGVDYPDLWGIHELHRRFLIQTQLSAPSVEDTIQALVDVTTNGGFTAV